MTHHCPTGSHPQPEYGCYTHHRCRCAGCTEANRRASADLHAVRRLLGRERAALVPAEPTRVRVRWLHDQGASDMWIAERCGVSESAVGYIRRGYTHRGPICSTQRSTARAVLVLFRRVTSGELHPPGLLDDGDVCASWPVCRRGRNGGSRWCRSCQRRRSAPQRRTFTPGVPA